MAGLVPIARSRPTVVSPHVWAGMDGGGGIRGGVTGGTVGERTGCCGGRGVLGGGGKRGALGRIGVIDQQKPRSAMRGRLEYPPSFTLSNDFCSSQKMAIALEASSPGASTLSGNGVPVWPDAYAR
eukprot:894381-Prymnesium_polylepis.1